MFSEKVLSIFLCYKHWYWTKGLPMTNDKEHFQPFISIFIPVKSWPPSLVTDHPPWHAYNSKHRPYFVPCWKKLVEISLCPSSRDKNKGAAWPAHVRLTQRGWKVVLSVIGVSTLFMHVISTAAVPTAGGCPLRSGCCCPQLSHRLTQQKRAVRTASLPKLLSAFLITPLSVTFLTKLRNTYVHRKYVKS